MSAAVHMSQLEKYIGFVQSDIEPFIKYVSAHSILVKIPRHFAQRPSIAACILSATS
jgi:hypothetical protein